MVPQYYKIFTRFKKPLESDAIQAETERCSKKYALDKPSEDSAF